LTELTELTEFFGRGNFRQENMKTGGRQGNFLDRIHTIKRIGKGRGILTGKHEGDEGKQPN
jgi:hypothetical protein